MHGQLARPALPRTETRAEHPRPAAEHLGRTAVISLLDEVGDHLRDANDVLGERASGMWMSVAARDLQLALGALHATGPQLPVSLRPAVRSLVVATTDLRRLAERMRGLVPPASDELPAIDLQLCRWTDAVRQLAAWLDGTHADG